MSHQLKLLLKQIENIRLNKNLKENLKKEFFLINDKYKNENINLQQIVTEKPEIITDIKNRLEKIINQNLSTNICLDTEKILKIIKNNPVNILTKHAKLIFNKIGLK
jgi:hypothetical protein